MDAYLPRFGEYHTRAERGAAFDREEALAARAWAEGAPARRAARRAQHAHEDHDEKE